MCWSLEVSVGSYLLISVLGGILLARNRPNDRWVAWMFLFVGQVQLAEALVWLSPGDGTTQGCGLLNKAASLALFGLVLCQPLVHCAVAHAYAPRKLRDAYLPTLTLLVAAGTVLLAWLVVPRELGCSAPCPATGHLSWSWHGRIHTWMRVLFCAVDLAPFLLMRPAKHAVALIAYVAGFFAFAAARYLVHGTFESMWCWYGAGGMALPFLLNYRGSLQPGKLVP